MTNLYQDKIDAGLVYDAETDTWKECTVPLEELREERNKLLTASDFSQLADVPFTDTQREEWVVYRQALRDLTEGYVPVEDPQYPIVPKRIDTRGLL